MKKIIQAATGIAITDEKSVREFLGACIFKLQLGLGFHPDNPFDDYIYKIGNNKNKQCFTKGEVKKLDKTLHDCFDQCEKIGLDIYEIGMEVMKPLLDVIGEEKQPDVYVPKPEVVFIPDAAKDQWGELEMHPVWDDGKGNCEPCEEGQESFWSVYVNNLGKGMQCIADLPTKKLAEDLYDLIENLIKSHSKNKS